MKWRDAHAATVIRHGGRLPTADEVTFGDVFVPDTALETDDAPDGGPIGRWRITRSELDGTESDGAPARWNLWDMRAYVAGRGAPEAIALDLPSPRSAVFLAEALDRSRILRVAHAGLVGLSRAVAGMRREWRSRT